MELPRLIQHSIRLIPNLFSIRQNYIRTYSDPPSLSTFNEFGNVTATLMNPDINIYYGPKKPREVSLKYNIEYQSARDIFDSKKNKNHIEHIRSKSFTLWINYINYKNVKLPIGFNHFESIRSCVEEAHNYEAKCLRNNEVCLRNNEVCLRDSIIKDIEKFSRFPNEMQLAIPLLYSYINNIDILREDEHRR